jgi:hypothetical protein
MDTGHERRHRQAEKGDSLVEVRQGRRPESFNVLFLIYHDDIEIAGYIAILRKLYPSAESPRMLTR